MVYVAKYNDKPVGFYALNVKTDEPQLEYMQIEPEFIGHGLVRIVWNHVLYQLRQ